MKNDLTSVEQHLLNTIDLVNIRGKGNARVPLLIPKDAKRVLQYILDPDVRKEVKVSENVDEEGQHILFATTGL